MANKKDIKKALSNSIKPKPQTEVKSKLKSIPKDAYPIQKGKPSGTDYKKTPATKKMSKNARAGQRALRKPLNEAFE